MKLLNDDELERSAVVANCRMNREREMTGSNGYSKEIGFNPLDYLRDRIAPGRRVAWLDLCCGTGKALIEAARMSTATWRVMMVPARTTRGQPAVDSHYRTEATDST